MTLEFRSRHVGCPRIKLKKLVCNRFLNLWHDNLSIIPLLRSSTVPFTDCQHDSKMLVQKIEGSPHKCILMCSGCFHIFFIKWQRLLYVLCIISFQFNVSIALQPVYGSCTLAISRQICSTVQFIPWRPWTGSCIVCYSFFFTLLLAPASSIFSQLIREEIVSIYFGSVISNMYYLLHLAVITGGLDSKLAVWDFSKGRTLFSIDYGTSLFHQNLLHSLHYLHFSRVILMPCPDNDAS
jgi:hypothetical protein